MATKTLTIDVEDLKTQLPKMLDEVSVGAEIIVTTANAPRAKIVAFETHQAGPRLPDLHPGAFQMTPDFDDPLPMEFWVGKE